jgi:hypothetical protein
MVPLPQAVKAEIVEGGSGNRIIGTYGGLDGLYIVIYFTGAVRNENTSCKAFGSFLISVCFEVFPE